MAMPDLARPEAPPTPPTRGRRGRRPRRLAGKDMAVVAGLLGVAIAIDVAFIWGPTIASVVLSFSSWNGVGEIEWVGAQNYDNIANNYPPFWPALRHNVLWLAFLGLVATPLGLFFAVLLDKEIRFTRLYQSALYVPVVLSLGPDVADGLGHLVDREVVAGGEHGWRSPRI